ncbi:hypothetical protein GCM10025868_46760 [Angustibacter aerolatus]|uniref:Uncharacterized protein n=1 Tax=Angustibacter aerolatus TaxID=1162965 RepID=A0ABQ6JMB7_9ACTN|nr:hypothetical protein GCM10025868_46760 [Angustibacter aerolatus]
MDSARGRPGKRHTAQCVRLLVHLRCGADFVGPIGTGCAGAESFPSHLRASDPDRPTGAGKPGSLALDHRGGRRSADALYSFLAPLISSAEHHHRGGRPGSRLRCAPAGCLSPPDRS